MRLLHTETLELHEFIQDEVPLYAILSHTWGEGEISFQDMYSGEVDQKAGYDKLQRCCKVAAADGLEYVWIDTCCIDKTSSSELSEAINSMFRWYQEAQVCYAYLSDVASGLDYRSSEFRQSRWFTRGWTLQELIAPRSLIFFSEGWIDIGTKWSLKSLISDITGIDVGVFNGTRLGKFSVAQKMSWASQRETTRIEDTAYCLMGMFGIHMPMMYGEGDRAFMRLQEEILRYSDDQTILAWKAPRNEPYIGYLGGFLAPSPLAFATCGRIERTFDGDPPPIKLRNGRIEIQLALTTMAHDPSLAAVLACKEAGSDCRICISLAPTPGGRVSEYNRTLETGLLKIDEASLRKNMNVTILNRFVFNRQPLTYSSNLPTYVKMDSLFAEKISLVKIHHPQELNMERDKAFMLSFSDVGLWMLRFQDLESHTFDLRLERQIWVTGTIATAALFSADSLNASWPTSMEGSDRVKWLWSNAMLWILVNIRAEAIDGRAACVVHLSCQNMEAQGVHEAKAPKVDAPLPRRIRKDWLPKGLNSQSLRLLPAPRIVPVESTRGFTTSGYTKTDFPPANDIDNSEFQKHRSI